MLVNSLLKIVIWEQCRWHDRQGGTAEYCANALPRRHIVVGRNYWWAVLFATPPTWEGGVCCIKVTCRSVPASFCEDERESLGNNILQNPIHPEIHQTVLKSLPTLRSMSSFPSSARLYQSTSILWRVVNSLIADLSHSK